MRGPIPQKKFEQFKKAALNPRESVQWYSRHLMWHYASEMVRGQGGAELEYLNEKDAEGRYKLTDQMYEACLKRMQQNLEAHRKREGHKYKRGAGARSRDDREGGGRYGTEREQYNGEGGGPFRIVCPHCLVAYPGTFICLIDCELTGISVN